MSSQKVSVHLPFEAIWFSKFEPITCLMKSLFFVRNRSLDTIPAFLLILAIALLAGCDFKRQSELRQLDSDSTPEQNQQTSNENEDSHEESIDYRDLIQKSQLTIYDSLEATPELFIPTTELESMLQNSLRAMLLDLPIRTRSKYVKSAICESLGYPVPKSFSKTQPRFPGQNFDVYVQKSNNLQIWNEALDANRRYVLVRVGEDLRVSTVRVVTGHQLVKLDTTGTLTRKLQARAIQPVDNSRLVSLTDTPEMLEAVRKAQKSEDESLLSSLLTTKRLYEKLLPLIGTEFENPGNDQERNRGWGLHKVVSKQLGLELAEDDGQFPDVRDQLLELKLQTAGTIDLGLVSPRDDSLLPGFDNVRNCDVRYAIFFGTKIGDMIRLDHLVLTNGADFFTYFQQTQGNVENTKNQIRLPNGFFEE